MPNPDEKDIEDETAELVERLRALARCDHDDLSVAEEAADLLERLSRERGTVPEGWQDISTAPKDGSKILAWDGDYVIVKANPDGGWSDDFQQYLRLDKWMPLPAPPINADPKPDTETE
jgi:hypothetical protein